MKCIFCILGLSSAGKDTMVNKVVNSITGISKAIPVTTRPIRINEKNGVDYDFLKEEDFDKLVKRKELISVREYKVRNGEIWKYAFDKEYFLSSVDNNIILATDIQGYSDLKKALPGYRVFAIFLQVPYHILVERLKKRGTPLNEIYRRLIEDTIRLEKADANLVRHIKRLENTNLKEALNNLILMIFKEMV